MKIDFSKIHIKGVDGKVIVHDLSKELGNVIFQQTTDIGELDLARDIYHKAEIEVDKKTAGIIKGYVDKGFRAFIKESLFPALDKIINGELDKVERKLTPKK